LEELRALFADTEKKAAETDDPRERARLADVHAGVARAIWKLGDRAALPFLEEKSLSADIHAQARGTAAAAYIAIAGMDEGAAFMRRWYFTMEGAGWRNFAYMRFLEKISKEAENAESGTLDNIHAFLLEIVQNSDSNGVSDANQANVFLLAHLPGYADSRQRATLQRYANTGNEWRTNTFNPIKAHFDAIPPSKRTDLRIRYPGLPPLPDDPPEADASAARRVWLITTAVGVAALLAAALALLRRAKKAGAA